MTKEGRIGLGKQWKEKLLINKAANKQVHVVPRNVGLDHSYIQEYEASLIKHKAPAVKKPAAKEAPKE